MRVKVTLLDNDNEHEILPSLPYAASKTYPSDIDYNGHSKILAIGPSSLRQKKTLITNLNKIDEDYKGSDKDDTCETIDCESQIHSLDLSITPAHVIASSQLPGDSSIISESTIKKDLAKNHISHPPISTKLKTLPRPIPIFRSTEPSKCHMKKLHAQTKPQGHHSSRSSNKKHRTHDSNCSSCRFFIVALGFICVGLTVLLISRFENILHGNLRPKSDETVLEEQSDNATINHGWIGCNGLESNCHLRLNEVMFASVHNAMSSKEDHFNFPNNFYNVEKALVAGYRAFFLDTCDCTPEEATTMGMGLKFCHGWCSVGSRDPGKLLRYLIDFLKVNEGEVIILEFEIGDSNTTDLLQSLWTIMSSVEGFAEMVYVYDETLGKWPTLGELVDINQRIILFQHNGPACNEGEGCPEQFHTYYDYVVESTFSVSSIEDMEKTSSCALVLGNGGARTFMNLNHFITGIIPDSRNAMMVNSRDFLERRFELCGEYDVGLPANFLTVDFWSLGDVAEIVHEKNKKRGVMLVNR